MTIYWKMTDMKTTQRGRGCWGGGHLNSGGYAGHWFFKIFTSWSPAGSPDAGITTSSSTMKSNTSFQSRTFFVSSVS